MRRMISVILVMLLLGCMLFGCKDDIKTKENTVSLDSNELVIGQSEETSLDEPAVSEQSTASVESTAVSTEAPTVVTTEAPTEAPTETPTEPATEPADVETTEPTQPVPSVPDKKVIFIGNSYTQNGMAVIWKNINVLSQDARSNDHGMFYQLCKENGMEVAVTNWCFGGHSLYHTFGGPCTQGGACKGVDHASYLTDREFDYVVIQCHKEAGYDGDLLKVLEPVMGLFRVANPNVKFLLLVPHMAYEKNDVYVNDLANLKGNGITICSWGSMVYDICSGKVQVPGAKQEHTRSSYVVSVSESDGYHENMLAGYLTALMTYCAITGESAVGQPYDFCNDPTIHPKFNIALHRRQYYTYDTNTNFDQIFASPEDIRGLQELVDVYLKLYN